MNNLIITIAFCAIAILLCGCSTNEPVTVRPEPSWPYLETDESRVIQLNKDRTHIREWNPGTKSWSPWVVFQKTPLM